MVAEEDSRKGNEYDQWQETDDLYDSPPSHDEFEGQCWGAGR